MILSGAVTWNTLDMHRFSISCFGLAALIALSCGAPAELDESLFPDTYTGDDQTGTAGAGSIPAGTGGTMPSGTAGSVAGIGGSVPAGGTSGAPPVGGGGTQVAAGGGGGGTNANGCPSDIQVLFNRPVEQGGCAGGFCHQPGGLATPDLISPDPLPRLLGVASSCNGIPYIGATPEESFIQLKITTPPDNCGLAMPFTMPEALSAADEACILAWVAENAGG